VPPLEIAVLGLGYTSSLVVIARFAPVVRERRWRWLVAHHLGVVAIVAVAADRNRPPAVVVNSAWLVASSAWYVLGGRRRRLGPSQA